MGGKPGEERGRRSEEGMTRGKRGCGGGVNMKSVREYFQAAV